MAIKVLDHSKSFHNLRDLQDADICGCFHCERIFSPDEIKDWTDVEVDEVTGEKTQGTAICPYCGIDSVIAEDNENVITPENLKNAHKEYFERVYRLKDIK